MLVLHFLEVADPVSGFGIRAGFKYDGKRWLSLVTSQNGTYYVRSGHKTNGDLILHKLSNSQSEAVEAFNASADYSIEFFNAPIK